MTSIPNITPQPPASPQRAELVRQARIWVAQTFYGTMLRQMHNSPFKSELFSGGRGGEVFQSLLDQRLTERMGRGAASPLVNSIVRHIERGRGVSAQMKESHVAPASGT